MWSGGGSEVAGLPQLGRSRWPCRWHLWTQQQQLLCRLAWQLLQRVHVVTTWSRSSPVGHAPKEMKASLCTRVCPGVCVEALSITTKQQTQPKCPSEDKCINTMWSIHPTPETRNVIQQGKEWDLTRSSTLPHRWASAKLYSLKEADTEPILCGSGYDEASRTERLLCACSYRSWNWWVWDGWVCPPTAGT